MRKANSIVASIGFALLVCLALLFFVLKSRAAVAAPAATTWYVDASSGSNGSDCLTPATACLTVSEAVTRAVNGDSVQIAAGVYNENLDLSKILTITGAGPNSTFLDGNNSHRILVTGGIAELHFADLTFQNGRSDNDWGGAIFNRGALYLTNVRVYSSTTGSGGGGIYNSGSVWLDHSEVISNSSQSGGGGIFIWSNGAVTATNSLIAYNHGNQGGGIYALNYLRATDTVFRGNRSDVAGGALLVGNSVVELDRVTFVENRSDGTGAGIYNQLGVLTMTNVTLAENTADNYTAVANLGSGAVTTIRSSTIANNQASTGAIGYGGVVNFSNSSLTIQNTIMAHNDDRNCLGNGNWASAGHNLSTDTRCGFTAPGDLQNVDPQLGALATYGGVTPVYALRPGSAAIDGGTNMNCPPVDQRGVSRPYDGDSDGTATCDIGAYEARNQLAVGDVTLLEGTGSNPTAVFAVTMSPTSTQPVTVAFNTMDETAVAGSDYLTGSGTLVFSPGDSVQTVPVTIIGDADDEPDETFRLQLGSAGGGDIVDGVGVATIIDDDGLSSLAVADVIVQEGNAGTTTASFIVSLSPAATQAVTVSYATADGTAAAGVDYVAANGTLVFAPGETTQIVDVSVNGDLTDEVDTETFTLNLSNAANANVADGSATGTIEDDDIAQVSLTFTPGIREGNSGDSTLVFTVTLSTPAAFPVTVDYETSSAIGGSGFATPTVDYQPVSGTLMFAPGATLETIPVLIHGDTEIEPDETFSMRLRNANPISIYAGASTGRILNDDGNIIYLPLIVR